MANKPTLDEMRLALSKVPKTLYHGTGADIKEFRPNSFLSDDPKIAGMYAKSQHRAVEGSGPNIMPVHANLKNPFIFDESDARRQGSSFGKMIAPHASTKNRFSEAIKILKAKGHDGVVLQNFDDIGGRQNQYIVFDPRHIKSAIGNRGTYDINDPDITKSNGGEVLPHHQREANKAKFLEPSKAKERLYHATGADIKEFDKSKVKRPYFGHGFHMAESPTLANFYADQHKEGQNVMPVHAQIKNPFVLKSMTDWYDVPGNTDAERTNWVKSQGYDGIKYPHGAPYNAPHESGTGWVAFEPTQIKSAIGNRGTYDTTNPDITKSKGGIVSLLRKHGRPVDSDLDAMRKMSNGHRVFVAHEQDEIPTEIHRVSDMHGYTPDQIYTVDPKHFAKGGLAYPVAPRGEWYGEGTYDTEGGVMKQVSPDAYLAKVRPLVMDEMSRENIDLLKEHIKSGKTLDPLLIRASGKEDGRHRAHAAKELGIKKVPVIDYGKHFARGGITHAHHLDIEERPL